jgi:hypothetical protein
VKLIYTVGGFRILLRGIVGGLEGGWLLVPARLGVSGASSGGIDEALPLYIGHLVNFAVTFRAYLGR